MAEDERSVEQTDENALEEGDVPGTEDDELARENAPADEMSPDEIADSFFELDDDLDVPSGRSTPAGRRRGLVVGADRVGREAIPDGYPLEGEPDRALALTVDLGSETTTVYLAWPDGGEPPLTWLLDAMDIELRDLYGREVLVDSTGGYDTLVTPTERPRGSDKSGSILAGLGVIAAVVGVAAIGGIGLPLFLLWLGTTLLWLPYAVFRDGWYLRTHSDWDGGPLFWATLSALPLVNLLVGVVYLRSRGRASFFGEVPSLLDRVVQNIRSWL